MGLETIQETAYDEQMLKIIKDPVEWAKYHLKTNGKAAEPRWYQEQILRHPHNRITLRCGRRVGKCIAHDQRIINSETGEYDTIQELYDKKVTDTPVFTLNNRLKSIKSKTFYIEDNGIKPVFRVTTQTGREVKITKNHPLLTLQGWKNLEDLNINSVIGVAKSIPVFGQTHMEEEYATLLGYLTTSGSIVDNTLQMHITNDDMVLNNVKRICKKYNIKIIKKSKTVYYLVETDDKFKDIIIGNLFDIPKEVYTYDKETLANYLRALMDSRGWVANSDNPQFGITYKNKNLIINLKHLLLRFGIQTNTTKRIVGKVWYYSLVVYRTKSTYILMTEILQDKGFRDYDILRQYEDVDDDRTFSIDKSIWEYIKHQQKIKKMNNYQLVGDKDKRLRPQNNITERILKDYATNLDDDYLMDIATSDIIWEKIVDIEYVGDEQTYDVFVPETHNLIIEDIFVHNTWTMCAHMLWVAFTGNGGKLTSGATCVVATPYDTQARLIFDQLNTFINDNEVLKDSVVRMTRSPYYIEFKNGGKIKLFTAGTKTGSEGGALRGQSATWLYLDKPLSLYVVTHIE